MLGIYWSLTQAKSVLIALILAHVKECKMRLMICELQMLRATGLKWQKMGFCLSSYWEFNVTLT